MIEKNGKHFEIPKEQMDVIRAKYHNKHGHFLLKWDERQGIADPEKVLNGVPAAEALVFKTRYPIPTRQIVYGKNGEKDEFRYFENKQFRPGREDFKYLPRYLSFPGAPVTDPEIQWFLIFCCPEIGNGIAGKTAAKIKKDYKPVFNILLEEQEALQELESRRVKNEVETIIHESGEEADLRDIAAIYRIPNADSESINVLRLALIKILDVPNKLGDKIAPYKEFKARYESLGTGKLDKNDEIKLLVEKAKAAGVIEFDNKASVWKLNDDEEGIVLCRVAPEFKSKRDSVLVNTLSRQKPLFNQVKDAYDAEAEADELEPETNDGIVNVGDPEDAADFKQSEKAIKPKKPGRPAKKQK